jgi:hypothetical protein
MTARRPLGELLGELAGGAAAVAGGGAVYARSFSISVPIDLRLVATETGLQVIGDVPQFITRTAFDPEPARLSVEWHAIPSERMGEVR